MTLGVYTNSWRVYAYLLVGLALFSSGGVVQGRQASKTVAELRADQAKGLATRAKAARTDETKSATKESKHAQDTIYNVNYLANLKTGIDDVQRRELVYVERLQHGAEGRAATCRAQAQADAAARDDLADKAAALDRQLAEGIGMVAEFEGDLRRRDA